MASRIPDVTYRNSSEALPACLTPGSLGYNDYANPNWLLQGGRCLAGDSPGPLGMEDFAMWLAGHQSAAPDAPIAAARLANAKAAPAAQASTSPLSVSRGQITFDAEGNDNLNSPYFSRKIHWPGNALSGVTIGRGYDMGSRTAEQVVRDLTSAGMAADLAKKFGAGAGKKGDQAKKFVKEHRDALGEISHAVQKNLFENVYPTYETRAQQNYAKWTTDAQGKPLAGKVEWDHLDPAIRDILVDFVYQGFTQGPNPMRHGMKSNYDELIDYIKNNKTLQQYEAGRKRVQYLENAKRAKQARTPPI
jgi:hypothetical protein